MKKKIFDELNKIQMKELALPEYGETWIKYKNKLSQFESTLNAAGAELIVCDKNDVIKNITSLAEKFKAQKIVSTVIGHENKYHDVSKDKTAHDMQDVDIAVIEGEFAVAENAAIWVEAEKIPFRSLLYLCQHLVILLKKDSLVNHMAEAYNKISFGENKFGQFISGPSKTADIEQALVIGAHGPLSTTIIFYEDLYEDF